MARHPAFRALVLASAALVFTGQAYAQSSAEPAGDEDVIVTGLRTNDASSGTKSDTPLVETPQSISVVTEEDFAQRGVVNLNQALQYTAGIAPDERGATATRYDQLRLRGFAPPQYLDGLRQFNGPYSIPQVDVSRLQRVEVVKGPASVLYGQAAPGGIINLVSKIAAEAAPYGSVAVTGGTFNVFRVNLDVGGGLNESGSIAYRVNATVNGSDSQLSYGKSRRYSISPSITFGLGGDTTWTVLANYQNDPEAGTYGIQPLYGTVLPNPLGEVPHEFYDGDPNFEKFKRKQTEISSFFTHRFSSDLVFKQSTRFSHTDVIYNSVYGYYVRGPNQTPTDYRTIDRGTARSEEQGRAFTSDNQLSAKFDTGGLAHSLLVGLDYQQSRYNQQAGFGSAPTIDLFAPVYNQTIVPPALSSRTETKTRQIGVYAQDQIKIGGLRLTASGRHDWYRSELLNEVTGVVDEQTKSAFTGRVGALYITDFGLAPYVSYSTSFQPQSGLVLDTSAPGGQRQANPSMGRQIEGGLKFQPLSSVLITASVFNIKQTNLLTYLPVSFAAIEDGEVTDNGWEVEANITNLRGFDLTAAYGRQNPKTTKSATPGQVGNRPIGSSKETASILAGYTIQDGGLRGLRGAGGVRYVGSSFGDPANTIEVKPYTLFDAALSYNFGRDPSETRGLDLVINVTNVFDRRHVTSCYVSFFEWCWYGSRRTAHATLSYKW